MKNLESFMTKDVAFYLGQEVIIRNAEVRGVVEAISLSSDASPTTIYRVSFPRGAVYDDLFGYDYDFSYFLEEDLRVVEKGRTFLEFLRDCFN